jgi:hypothetical protein
MGGIRTAYYPIIEHNDVCSPTVSRFGGSFCKLPEETFPLCCFGSGSFINIVQLYIPTLPAEIQNLFPESKRKCLLVYQICSECLSWEKPIVKLYFPEDFEKLEFSKSQYSLKPSHVTEWKQYDSMMYSLQLTYFSEKLISEGKPSFFLENDPDKYHEHFFEKIRETVEKLHPRHNSNLGAFPDFVQDDETPEGFEILANFEEDEICNIMWGDAGTAQLWVRTDDDNVELKATWNCS